MSNRPACSVQECASCPLGLSGRTNKELRRAEIDAGLYKQKGGAHYGSTASIAVSSSPQNTLAENLATQQADQGKYKRRGDVCLRWARLWSATNRYLAR